jgi:DNA-binding response OmpR family regulator
LDSQPSLFVFQLFGCTIQQDMNARRIIIDNYLLDFSCTEYALMALLLQHARQPCDFAPSAELCRTFSRSPVASRRTLSRRIRKMSEKLWPFALDILNVGDCGYMLTCKWE